MSQAPLLYAFTLGLVAALNPCGFPLLPAYLSGFVGGDARQPWAVRTGRALVSAGAVTVGFVAVFAPLGGLVATGVDVVLGWVPWAMIPFGAAMVVVGAWTVSGRSLRIPLPVVPSGRDRHPALAMMLFGVAYAVASLSCALPVFVAGVSGTFGRDGVAGGLADFVAYALGMGLLLAVAALVVAHAGAPALRRVRRFGPLLQRMVGAVLVVVGTYLVLYWTTSVADPRHTPGPVRAVEHLQSLLVSWLSSAPRTVGLVLGLGVVAALVAVVVQRPHRAPPPPEGSGGPSVDDDGADADGAATDRTATGISATGIPATGIPATTASGAGVGARPASDAVAPMHPVASN